MALGINEATITFALGSMASIAGLVLGQSATEVPNWISIGGGAMSVGFIGWYAWYVTTVIIPQLVKDFKEESRADRLAFEEMRKALTEVFQSELRTERAASEQVRRTYSEHLEKLSDAFNKLEDRFERYRPDCPQLKLPLSTKGQDQ